MESLEYLTPADYEIAKQNGISYSIAYARFYRYGWDIKEYNRLVRKTVKEGER